MIEACGGVPIVDQTCQLKGIDDREFNMVDTLESYQNSPQGPIAQIVRPNVTSILPKLSDSFLKKVRESLVSPL